MNIKKLRILCALNKYYDDQEWLNPDEAGELKETAHEVTVVHTLKDFTAKLNASKSDKPYDVVLADFYMPQEKAKARTFYPIDQHRDLIRGKGVKCFGIFSPEHERREDYSFVRPDKFLTYLSHKHRTPTQQRDMISLLQEILDQWGAACDFDPSIIDAVLAEEKSNEE